MKNPRNSVIRIYFSDYVNWLLIVSFLFVVSLLTFIYFNEINHVTWIIPVCSIIIYLLGMPFLFLYLKVRTDLKKANTEKLIIKIKEIKDDRKFNFKNGGGATIGKNKYTIIDEADNLYLLSASNDKDFFTGFYPIPNFLLEIEYLKNSRLVLHMRIIENSKTIRESREQQHNIRHFKKVFIQYF